MKQCHQPLPEQVRHPDLQVPQGRRQGTLMALVALLRRNLPIEPVGLRSRVTQLAEPDEEPAGLGTSGRGSTSIPSSSTCSTNARRASSTRS